MATPETQVVAEIGNDYKFGFHDPENYFFKSQRGLSREIVAAISEHKNEPAWMRDFRLKSLDYFEARPMPSWGGDLSGIDFDNIYYYIRPDFVHVFVDGRIVREGGPELAELLEAEGYEAFTPEPVGGEA